MIALLGLPAGVPAEGADDGVVAEWHFEEGSGGVLGTIKVSSGHYIAMPGEVVMECLKRRGPLTLVVEPEPPATTLNSGELENRVPGFGVVAAGMILFAISLWRKRA